MSFDFEKFIEFARDSLSSAEEASKWDCNEDDHPPYADFRPGRDGKIHGCRCMWVVLKYPIAPVGGMVTRSWEDYPEAIYERR